MLRTTVFLLVHAEVRMIRLTLELLVFAGLTVGLLGCGQATEDANRAKTVEAVAIVTHKGAPVEGATVVFEPAASQPRGAMGLTDASGKAILRTYDAGDGAIPGAYQVAITKSATSAIHRHMVERSRAKPSRSNMTSSRWCGR